MAYPLKADGDEDVRMAALQVVAGELERDPALLSPLEDVAHPERAKGVRTAAQLALQRHQATRG